MQKKILFLLFLSITCPAFAQIDFGVKGGYSPYIVVSNSFDGETSYTPNQTAWTAGVYLSEDLLDKLRIRIQLDYTAHHFMVDSKWSGPNNWNHIVYSCSVGYINLYFVPQYTLGSKQRTYLFCGIYAGYLVNATMNGTDHYNYGGTIIGTDTADDVAAWRKS